MAGEKTAFARITMSGVGFASSATNTPAPRRQETAVLRLEEAEDLAAQLGELLSFMSRSTPTPEAPAMGLWAWRAEPPLDDDLLVADSSAGAVAIQVGGRVTPTIRVEFTGIAVQELASTVPSVHVQRAVFSGPRQVQTLISSLKKVVRSALEQRRTDVYVAADRPMPVLYLVS
jgi:hypothetical protein